MNLKEQLKTNLKEIEVYHSHGLFAAAKDKIKTLLELIRQSNQVKNKQQLMAAISKKLEELENDTLKFQETGAECEDLIDEYLSSIKDQGADSASLKRAIALLMHGRFEKALSKFNELLNNDSIRTIAAKNIIRCHVGLSSMDMAIMQYEEWVADTQFHTEELEEIASFLQNIMDKEGIDKILPITERTSDIAKDEVDEEDYIDILSIIIPLVHKDRKEDDIELEVSFQKGDTIGVIIPAAVAVLINGFEVGSILKSVKIFSDAIVFEESCVISEKTQIKSGPEKGGYILVMKVQNI